MLADYLDQFDQLFPGVSAAYNGKSHYVWSSGDPHILGAYSYLKVGQYTGFNGIQGQPEGNLHFAGEHTSIDFQGYIEGALQSGYRCAEEVAGGRGRARPA
jgi:monoamine oxidase